MRFKIEYADITNSLIEALRYLDSDVYIQYEFKHYELMEHPEYFNGALVDDWKAYNDSHIREQVKKGIYR